MFRRFSLLVIAISLLGASCVGGDQDKGLVDPFPKESITLTLWSSLDDYSAFQSGMQSYRDEHPNVSFNHQFVPADQFVAKTIDTLATGKGPDIILLPNDHIPKFKDTLVPMPEGFFGGVLPTVGITSQYAPAVATDVIHDGQVYGIPFYTDSLAIYVNTKILTKLFEEYIIAGKSFNQDLLLRAPADWSEVTEAVKLITKRNGNTIEQAGIALGTSNNVPFMSDITAALMLQLETAMVSPDRQSATFHLADKIDPTRYPGARALDFFKRFTDPNSEFYTWNADMPDAVQAFIDQKVALMINYQAIGPYLRQRNPSLQFTTGPLPQLPSARTIVDFARYRVEAVTNNSQNPVIAWDFLRHMNSLGLADYIAGVGRQSPTRQLPPTTTVAERIYRPDPFLLQIASARSWYKGPDPAAADRILNQTLDRVTRDGQDSRESLNQAAQDLTTILQSGP